MKGGIWDGLTQAEAGLVLGMSERGFRRYLSRYEADGLEGLIDRRLEQISNRRAPVDEVMALTELYQTRHSGWNVKHVHSWYNRDGGIRSYAWLKKHLQSAKLVPKAEKQGVHRKRRERCALERRSTQAHPAWPPCRARRLPLCHRSGAADKGRLPRLPPDLGDRLHVPIVARRQPLR